MREEQRRQPGCPARDASFQGEDALTPAPLYHCGSPLVSGVEPLLCGSADLRALEIAVDEHANFPAKKTRPQFAHHHVFGVALYFPESPEISALDGRAAPDGTL